MTSKQSQTIPESSRELVDALVRSMIVAGGSYDNSIVHTVTGWADLTHSPTLALASVAVVAIQGYAAAVQGLFQTEQEALDYLDYLTVLSDAIDALQGLANLTDNEGTEPND